VGKKPCPDIIKGDKTEHKKPIKTKKNSVLVGKQKGGVPMTTKSEKGEGGDKRGRKKRYAQNIRGTHRMGTTEKMEEKNQGRIADP